MGLPALIAHIIEAVKVRIIRRVAVEVLAFVIEVLERWLARLGAKAEGRELLQLLTQPQGKAVLEELVEGFV